MYLVEVGVGVMPGRPILLPMVRRERRIGAEIRRQRRPFPVIGARHKLVLRHGCVEHTVLRRHKNMCQPCYTTISSGLFSPKNLPSFLTNVRDPKK